MAVTEQDISGARENALSLGNTAAGMMGEMPKIGDVLKQKVIDAYNANQDIIKPLDEATQTYLGAPQAGREKYQNIFNPFQRENLVSQYIGNQALPMLSLSSIYGQRMGRADDLIGAGVRGYEGATAAAQGRANTAQSYLSNLLQEYQLIEDARQAQESGQLAREKFEWDKANPTGKGVETDLLKLLEILQKKQIAEAESEPMYTPAQGVGALSPQQEWVFTGQEWEPISNFY